MKWNRAFTDLIRNARAAYWGNWALDPSLKAGAVGFVSPDTGDFTLVENQVPGIATTTRAVPNQWHLSSTDVRRSEGKVNLDGSGTDPETGTKVKAGLEVKWEFSRAGSIASEFGIAEETFISDLGKLSHPDTFRWLADRAKSVSMGSDGRISQGFGVITSVIYARSGLNVGSEEEGSSFAIAGAADAVHEMLGGVNGKGSFVSTSQHKRIDKHLWPYQADHLAQGSAPIAYTFASFDGSLLIPNWITRLGAFEIRFNNKPGCTYVTHIHLSYDTPQGPHKDEFSLSGGLSRTVGNIPLTATNIQVKVKFQGVKDSDPYTLHWDTPLGQWLTGKREIEMSGVWPGATHLQEK